VSAVGVNEGVVVVLEDFVAGLAAPADGSLILLSVVFFVLDGNAVA
jgi:hypothetical protein